MPPSMQFHSFLQPLVASLEESDCLGFRPKMALVKPAPKDKRVQERKAKLGTGDPGALRQEVLRKECEVASVSKLQAQLQQCAAELAECKEENQSVSAFAKERAAAFTAQVKVRRGSAVVTSVATRRAMEA